MIIDPPIDKLITKVGCKYALVCLISKRARFLADKKPDVVKDADSTPVSYAAQELYADKIRAAYED